MSRHFWNCGTCALRAAVLLTTMLAIAPMSIGAAPSTGSKLILRKPTISLTQIAFSYGGDLWIVDRTGGDAHRLTSDVGIETQPMFSPDGSMIAFTGEYEGNEDVYVIAAAGGIPSRLTSHPAGNQVVGWTRDGKRVLFRSGRNSYARFNRLFTVSIDGGLPEELPLPMAEEGSYSPDSTRLAYVPFTNFRDSFSRVGLKHYRGGTASPIWIANLADSSIEKVPRQDSNDSTPMWVGDRVYFLSDRNGRVNLFYYDTATKQVREAIASNGADIKSASAGPDAIVYEQFGSIHVLDLANGNEHPVMIDAKGDFPAIRPHFAKVAERIKNGGISPTGARAVFEAHGEILTVPVEHGDIRNLTNSPAVADRDPAWSPDGKWIAYFSDEAGEYALHLRSQDGVSVRKIGLGTPPSFFYSPTWSPDSKKLAYSDKRLHLWYLDVDVGKPTLIATSPYDNGPGSGFDPMWSPDSRWIAYTRQVSGILRAVFVYGLEDKTEHQITDGLSDAAFAAFDKNGRYLYFTASTDVGPVLASSMAGYKIPVTRSGYVVVLSKDRKSPLAPQSDEETSTASTAVAGTAAAKTMDLPTTQAEECPRDAQAGNAHDQPDAGKQATETGPSAARKDKGKAKAATPVRIDFANIDQRILSLPFPTRNYTGMVAGKPHILYLLEGPEVDERNPGSAHQLVHKFDLCTRKTDKLLERVAHFYVSFNGEKALYEQLPESAPTGSAGLFDAPPHGQWYIKPVDALGKPPEPKKPDGALKLDAAEVYVDPRAEWNQIFHEVWRLERDFFYDPNLHGLNLKSQMATYQPYVDAVMSRADLNYIFAEMLGDITAQHIYVIGGDRPAPRRVGGGLLGADYTIEHDRYRIARIYRGENWNPELKAPLTEPGVNVAQGDYILAVNGRELRGADEIYRFFEETAGKAIPITVSADPKGKNARVVTVVPIASETSLRLHAWMEDNRRKVEQLSEGRLAYVYLPNTAANGFTNFNRYYFAQSEKQGAVIDERFNGGGWIADYIVDWLKRPLLAVAMNREGKDDYIPNTIRGPKVMIINEEAGSGGDALPWMFKRLGTGPLIGTRTWGGLIGIGGYPFLMDGGLVTAPRWAIFNPETGEFDVENKGVSPDIEVEFDPEAVRMGHDPQLEKAVAVALEELRLHPVPAIKRPKYPVYNWSTTK